MTPEISTITAPEGRGDPQLVQEVRRLVTTGDRAALLEYITAPPPAELAETTAWFAKGGRALLAQDLDWRIHKRLSPDETHLRSLVRQLVTVGISAPADAARFLPWREMAGSRNAEILMLLDVLVSQGGDWCRRFLAAAISRNAKAGEGTATAVVRHCLPLIDFFGVSTARFEAYPRLWAFYYRNAPYGVHKVWNDEIAAGFQYPGWSGLEFRIGPDGSAVIFPKLQKSLLELWDQDVTAAETLLRCFEVPDALAPLARRGNPKEWTVGAAVRGYLDRGTYSREEVFGKLRAALARDDGLPSQRVLADVLESFQPDSGQVAASIPILLSTVATAHGFLSRLAFGLLLRAPPDGDDLQGLSAAVFGRTEKKPQELLVRHLKALQTSGTHDAGVRTACWNAAAGSSDLKIRTVAESMLDIPLVVSTKEPTTPASLWETGGPERPRIPRYVALEVDSKKPLPRWSQYLRRSVSAEQYIDCFLRTVYDVPQFVRDRYWRRCAVEASPKNAELSTSWQHWVYPHPWAYPNPGVVLDAWASGEHTLDAHRNLTGLFRASLTGPPDGDDPFRYADPLHAVHSFRHSELAVQAGTVPYSLATPSYDNFRVELDRLVALLRLFEREGWTYGEADLFQALLRLGSLDRRLVADVPELHVEPLDSPGDPERRAGRILREWVGGGGFQPPAVDAPLTLPVPLERFPSIPRELLSPELWHGSGRGNLGAWLGRGTCAVVPFWPDLGAVWLDRGLAYGELVVLTAGCLSGATAGGLGQLTHDWLVSVLASHRRDDRERAIEIVLELAARGQFSADHLGMAARTCVEVGGPSLGRLVGSLVLVAYEGHLDCIWPALTSLVVAASGQQKLPAGTPELLATCTELWDSIPAEHRTAAAVPAEFMGAVLALASKAATKTALEAKRLSARMEAVPKRAAGGTALPRTGGQEHNRGY